MEDFLYININLIISEWFRDLQGLFHPFGMVFLLLLIVWMTILLDYKMLFQWLLEMELKHHFELQNGYEIMLSNTGFLVFMLSVQIQML